MCMSFGFIAPEQFLNYLTFQSVDFENTWWKLLKKKKKRFVRIKFDIDVFIIALLILKLHFSSLHTNNSAKSSVPC